jgi:hypothetical protein
VCGELLIHVVNQQFATDTPRCLGMMVLVKAATVVQFFGEVKRLRSNFIKGIKHLPVSLTSTL